METLRLLLQQTLQNALGCVCPAGWGYFRTHNYRFCRVVARTWHLAEEGLGQVSSALCHPSQPLRLCWARDGPDPPVSHPNTSTSQNHHQVSPTWIFLSHILCSLPVYYVFQLSVDFFFFFLTQGLLQADHKGMLSACFLIF